MSYINEQGGAVSLVLCLLCRGTSLYKAQSSRPESQVHFGEKEHLGRPFEAVVMWSFGQNGLCFQDFTKEFYIHGALPGCISLQAASTKDSISVIPCSYPMTRKENVFRTRRYHVDITQLFLICLY